MILRKMDLGILIKCTLIPKHSRVGDMLIMCCLAKFICACSPQLVVNWCLPELLSNFHQKVPVVYRLVSSFFSNLTWTLKTVFDRFLCTCVEKVPALPAWPWTLLAEIVKLKMWALNGLNGLFSEENQTWMYFNDKITCSSVYRQIFSHFRSFGPFF